MTRTRQSPARAFRLAAGVLGLLIGATVFAPLTLGAEPLKIDIAFSGMWWAEGQLEGMDVNSPPPKTTRAQLRAWDYGDGQWPPHPDVVDVDVTVSSATVAAKTTAEISYQYDIGRGRHLQPQQLVKTVVDLSPGGTTSLRGSLRIVADIGRLMDRKLVPNLVKVTVRVGGQPPATAQLPIVVGD